MVNSSSLKETKMEFLLFRLPKEKQFNFIKNQEAVHSTASFFPFGEGQSLHLFSDEVLEIEENQVFEILNQVEFPSEKINISIPNKEEYLEKINQAIAVVKENQWQKLVISRPLKVPFHQLDLAQTFLHLCEKYSQAFCYVWKSEGQLWLGATPELLGAFDDENSIFETMSLAGTLPIDEEWTEKEIEEQEAVTAYIQNVLHPFTENIKISPRIDQILGKIKHLKNEIKAKIDPNEVDVLIQKLHPTPAVCGIPKEQCQAQILEIEQYSRSFYTGYIKISMTKKTRFFVNLRCMRVFENEAILYVGGGITSKSNPEKEWQETELKSHTMLDYMVVKS